MADLSGFAGLFVIVGSVASMYREEQRQPERVGGMPCPGRLFGGQASLCDVFGRLQTGIVFSFWNEW